MTRLALLSVLVAACTGSASFGTPPRGPTAAPAPTAGDVSELEAEPPAPPAPAAAPTTPADDPPPDEAMSPRRRELLARRQREREAPAAALPPPAAAHPNGNRGFDATYPVWDVSRHQTTLASYGKCWLSPQRPVVIAAGQLSLWFTTVNRDAQLTPAAWIHVLADVARDGAVEASFLLTADNRRYLETRAPMDYAEDLRHVTTGVIRGTLVSEYGGHAGRLTITAPGLHFAGDQSSEWCVVDLRDDAYHPPASCERAEDTCTRDSQCCSSRCARTGSHGVCE